MTTQERRLSFGEVADEYDDVRADYPAELVQAVVAYAGAVPESLVEAGAGTGKATIAFAALGARMTCVEPDPEMAAVLSRHVAGDPLIDVVVSRFEDWTPPAGGVDVLMSAQAWHWVTPADRLGLAHAALRPGGVLVVCGHGYNYADPEIEAALSEVYGRFAPELIDTEGSGPPRPYAAWALEEMVDSPLFTDVTSVQFQRIVNYSTADYIRLLNTLSAHRVLPADRRDALFGALAEAADALGGGVRHQIDTAAALGRSV